MREAHQKLRAPSEEGRGLEEEAPDTTRSLQVVRVAVLQECLRTATTIAAKCLLLQRLGTTNDLLESVPSSSEIALVSYRQERREQKRISSEGPFDEFTIDGDTLQSIASAAASLGAEAIWLDVFCYRDGPNGYDHDHFLETLDAVTNGVRSVARAAHLTGQPHHHLPPPATQVSAL